MASSDDDIDKRVQPPALTTEVEENPFFDILSDELVRYFAEKYFITRWFPNQFNMKQVKNEYYINLQHFSYTMEELEEYIKKTLYYEKSKYIRRSKELIQDILITVVRILDVKKAQEIVEKSKKEGITFLILTLDFENEHTDWFSLFTEPGWIFKIPIYSYFYTETKLDIPTIIPIISFYNEEKVKKRETILENKVKELESENNRLRSEKRDLEKKVDRLQEPDQDKTTKKIKNHNLLVE